MPRLIVALLLATASALLTVGCARRPVVPADTVRLAVVDMPTIYEVARGSEVTVKGYWFSARDVIRSENWGRVTAEAVGREFSRIPGVEVYNREDLIIYLARKDQRARRAFPQLNAADRAELLGLQSPVDYGRSLNVDFVMLPIVEDSRMVRNHFLDSWFSKARLRLELWDVREGRMVWTWAGRDSDLFDSQLDVIEDIVRSARKAAERQDAFGFAGGRRTG